ncbi:hypothetical protein E2C01_068160 [Portunus trituberculatus]|uniref:Uncharacterized protein n=1 Tax=Portunus trituberculatus TaxID=210409 RepID=A0A5B7HLQ7_PORTR|nr:hypothetical protein [Portunus trituberculatus]
MPRITRYCFFCAARVERLLRESPRIIKRRKKAASLLAEPNPQEASAPDGITQVPHIINKIPARPPSPLVRRKIHTRTYKVADAPPLRRRRRRRRRLQQQPGASPYPPPHAGSEAPRKRACPRLCLRSAGDENLQGRGP